jgi:formylmethanofuran dehydrogenase subunit E
MNPISFRCEDCNRSLGETYAERGLLLHGKVICGDCAQEANPEYHKWKAEQVAITV